MRAFFLRIVVSLLMTGCATEHDCFIADSIKELEAVQTNEGERFLYLRTTGFNDKEHFFELFKGKAKFDECGQTTSTFTSQAHVDDTEGFPTKLLIANDAITVVYAAEAQNQGGLDAIEIEVVKPAVK